MNFSGVKEFMDHLTDWRMPGNGIVIYKDNKEVFSYTSGYADIESKTPFSNDMHMHIYSCSKPATIAAVMQLTEKGLLTVDTPLYDIIPEYRKMYIKTESGIREAETPITIHHLLTMTAGLSYNYNTSAFETARKETNGRMDTVTVIRCLASDPLLFNPGERFSYSLCHDVLAAVVELVSGKRFADYMQEHIFAPLDMDKSTLCTTPEIEANMVTQYKFVNSDETDIVKMQFNALDTDGHLELAGQDNYLKFGPDYDAGGAGIITTINDYIKFALALSNNGTGINGEQILKPETVKTMSENKLTAEQLENYHKLPQCAGCGYGYGVRTPFDEKTVRREFGWGGAAGATIFADNKENIAAFYSHYMLNQFEEYYQPILRNKIYESFNL